MTQKNMLEQYAIQNGFTNIVHYVDDGFRGTNFDRPGFLRLVDDIKSGKIETVITKDLSRLGRDYLKTGYYLEEFFPMNNVRFIAINDDVDTLKVIPELTPFKNIMNEWYAKDISKKIRSAYRTKALKGQFTASYTPYGYKKDPNDKHHLIVDREAADVVKEIFLLASIGKSLFEIANHLKSKKILKPRAKILKENGKYDTELWNKHPYDLSPLTISSMIQNEEYLGHIVGNKNTTASFKSKKLVRLPKEKWIVVENMHEAIVDKISKINNEILDYKQQENKLIEFIKVVSNYNQIEELNIKILNDFINKVIIHERDIINSKRSKKLPLFINICQWIFKNTLLQL